MRAVWSTSYSTPRPSWNSEWQPHLCPDSQDDLLGTIWPFGTLFSHLSYCETAVKMNAVPDVQGQAEITCSRPNEKQTEGLNKVTLSLLFYEFVVCKVEWGRRREWFCWFLWLPCVSSKDYFILIVAKLILTLVWKEETPFSSLVCLMNRNWPTHFTSLSCGFSRGERMELDSPSDGDGKQVSSPVPMHWLAATGSAGMHQSGVDDCAQLGSSKKQWVSSWNLFVHCKDPEIFHQNPIWITFCHWESSFDDL